MASGVRSSRLARALATIGSAESDVFIVNGTNGESTNEG